MSILIAMSGGVDSSVTAYLMSQKYKTCKGATMLLQPLCHLKMTSSLVLGETGQKASPLEGRCLEEAEERCSGEEMPSLLREGGRKSEGCEDARLICEKLGIDFEVLDYRNEFAFNVIKNFIEVYDRGGTPNPCIDCNRTMKFGKFLEHAHSINLEKIATGHYVKIENNTGRYLLRKARDLTRDQSYVLYMLKQEQLKCVEFPLGDYTKNEVRSIAEELNFVNAKRSDSQDICFVPDGDYAKFIENYTGKNYKPGNFVDSDGKVLGTHKGIIHYTIGQRRGLGVAAKSRLYITRINAETNEITLAFEDEKNLLSKRISIENINLIPFDVLPENFSAKVKVRYRQNEVPATLNQISPDKIIIEFQNPISKPAVGQSAVIYKDDYVIGGGIIKSLL